MSIDLTAYENKVIRIGSSPLRYGYVLRGKKHEYSSDQVGILMALDKQKVLIPVRIEQDVWAQIPNSIGLAF